MHGNQHLPWDEISLKACKKTQRPETTKQDKK